MTAGRLVVLTGPSRGSRRVRTAFMADGYVPIQPAKVRRMLEQGELRGKGAEMVVSLEPKALVDHKGKHCWGEWPGAIVWVDNRTGEHEPPSRLELLVLGLAHAVVYGGHPDDLKRLIADVSVGTFDCVPPAYLQKTYGSLALIVSDPSKASRTWNIGPSS